MLFAVRANPQLAEFCIQRVPASSGKLMALAAVATDPRVVRKFVDPAQEIFPLLRIVNLVAPLFDAVNRSPTPVLSTRKPAKEVAPDTEAIAVVPELARTSKVARGEVVPMPTLPDIIYV